MVYTSEDMEMQAVLQTAAKMCAAARTAPKAMGKDDIVTMVFTGQEKDQLADKMNEIGVREFGEKAGKWYGRDAENVRRARAVVLIGIHRTYRGVPKCGFCGFADCGSCRKGGGTCAFAYVDLGIALSSAAAVAADDRIDNRIMFSVGKAVMEIMQDEDVLWHGIPLHAAGKNIFMDRK